MVAQQREDAIPALEKEGRHILKTFYYRNFQTYTKVETIFYITLNCKQFMMNIKIFTVISKVHRTIG